ncbi:hypothetical protein LMH73_011055 [Vibrio splendidus]|nr:hypothetical protein [Vibrio splendidus]MCC4880764.1 hypothetical protein [Vibrio splendidus]
MTNYFNIINDNKNILSNHLEIDESKSTITTNGNTFDVSKATIKSIAKALEKAKSDPATLGRLNNLFNAEHIQLAEHQRNQKLLIVASDYFKGWYETNEANDFDFATEFALMDLEKKNKDNYINFLMCPDNRNVYCNYYAVDGKSSFEIHHYKDINNAGLLYQADTFDEVIAKYEKRKDSIPDPISIHSERAVAFVDLPNDIKAEVTATREGKGLTARYIYDVKLLSNSKESKPIQLAGDMVSLMDLRDGRIGFEEFGVTPNDITIQSDVLQSDITINYKQQFSAEDIQKSITQLANGAGNEDYSKWLTIESDVSPYQLSIRIENPKHLEEDHNPNIDFQLKHKDGSYVATFESTTISPDYILRILSSDNIFVRDAIDSDMDQEMRDEDILDIPASEIRIEDYAVRYAAFVGDCISVHVDEVNERKQVKESSFDYSI